jgi:hypothetical protein
MLNAALNVREFLRRYKQFQTQTKLNAGTVGRYVLIDYRKLMFREHNRTLRTELTMTDSQSLRSAIKETTTPITASKTSYV